MPGTKLSSVASLAKERSAWNKVMTSTYGVKLKGTNRFKRTTRTKVNKRAARARKVGARTDTVDDARVLHEARLELLDINNPNEDVNAGEGNEEDEDEDYEVDEDYDDEEGTPSSSSSSSSSSKTGSKRKRKNTTTASKRTAKKLKGSKNSVQAKALERNKLLPRPCTMEQALLDPEAEAIVASVQTGPTNCYARKFCPVTGLVASFRDPSTGVPYATKGAYGTILERTPKIW